MLKVFAISTIIIFIILNPLVLGQENASNLLHKGYSLYSEKRYNDAIEYYNKAINKDPKYALAWYDKGLAQFWSGDYKGSIESYKEAVKSYNESPSHNPFPIDDCWFNMGNSFLTLREYEEAIKCYDEAIAISPMRELIWINKGFAFYNIGNYEKAIECYEQAIFINPDDEKGYNNEGVILSRLGKYNRSIELYDEALILDPRSAIILYNKGISLQLSGRYGEAIKSYDKAIEIAPTNPDFWNNRGDVLLKLGRNEEAYLSYDNATKLRPDFDAAWNGKGVSLANENRTDESLEAFNRAIRLNNTTYIEAWNNKAKVLKSIDNRKAEALEAYVKVRAFGVSNELRLGIPILCLIIYFLFLLKYHIAKRSLNIPTRSKIIFANLFGFFALYYVLLGYFSINVLLIFLVIGALITILTIMAISFLSSSAIMQTQMIDRICKGYDSKEALSFRGAIPYIAIIGYPVLASLGYFRFYFPSEQTSLWIFRGVMIIILLLELASTAPIILSMLLSRSLDNAIRDVFLVYYAGVLCMISLFFSLLLFSFNIGNAGNIGNVANIDMQSIIFLAFLLSLILFMLLSPYFLGWLRARSYNKYLLGIKLRWITDIVNVIEIPNTKVNIKNLKKLKRKMKLEQEQVTRERGFHKTERVPITKKVSNENDKINIVDDPYHMASEERIRRDPIGECNSEDGSDQYSSYQQFLAGTIEEVGQIIEQFETLQGELSFQIELMGKYCEIYRSRKDEIGKLIDEEKQAKPLLWIGLTSILGVTLSSAISLLGDSIIKGLGFINEFMTTLSQSLLIK